MNQPLPKRQRRLSLTERIEEARHLAGTLGYHNENFKIKMDCFLDLMGEFTEEEMLAKPGLATAYQMAKDVFWHRLDYIAEVNSIEQCFYKLHDKNQGYKPEASEA